MDLTENADKAITQAGQDTSQRTAKDMSDLIN